MSIKLIAVDLDHTLLRDDGKISQENYDAIKILQEKGIKIVICTGRPTGGVTRFVDDINSNGEETYYIAYNGSYIINTKHGVISKSELSKDDVRKGVELGRKWNITMQLYKDDALYVEDYNEKVKEYESLLKVKAHRIDDLLTLGSSIKILYSDKAGPDFDEFKLKVEEILPDKKVFFSKPNYLEVIDKDSGKGEALEKVVNILGLKQSEVMAIGDGFNDLSMIEYAHIGIATDNAPDGVKIKADAVLKSNNNESIMVEILASYFPGNN